MKKFAKSLHNSKIMLTFAAKSVEITEIKKELLLGSQGLDGQLKFWIALRGTTVTLVNYSVKETINGTNQPKMRMAA